MRQMHKLIIAGLLLTAMNLVAISAQAASSVGKVIVSIGNVVAVDGSGKERALKRLGKIFEGDTIRLGENSRLQARFIDNQLLALKENTVFRIDEYKFNGKQDGSESVAMSLLKGGMRSVTGVIGKVNKEHYKLKTPVATLGVRGTIWSGQLCLAGSCGSDVADGFYGAVSDGAVVIMNQAGEQVFTQDQFFHVPTPTSPPRQISNPPAIVVENETPSEEEVAEAIQEASSGTESETLAGDITDPNGEPLLPPPPPPTSPLPAPAPAPVPQPAPLPTPPTVPIALGGVLAPAGAGVAVAGVIAPGDAGGTTIVLDMMSSDSFKIATVNGVGNQLVAFQDYDMTCMPCTLTVYDNATASEIGGNSTLGVNWGRWSATGTELIGDLGTQETITAGGVAYAYSPNITTPSQLSMLTGLGTQTYTFSNGPSFRDEAGAVVTGTGSITANFSSGLITGVSLNLSGNGRSYSASATGSVSFGNEVMLSGFCSGGSCGTSGTTLEGNASGIFVGPNAEGAIGYFGLHDVGKTLGVAGAGLFLR